jgi:hypothetical protein
VAFYVNKVGGKHDTVEADFEIRCQLLTQLSDITIIPYFSVNGYSIIPHRKLS